MLLPTLRGLSERQHQLFFVLHSMIAEQKPDGLVRLVDDDLAEAAASLAATLETAARGVIYDHPVQSIPAQRLVTELKGLIELLRQQGGEIPDREAAVVLRAIEKGARETRLAVAGDSAYLTLMGRLIPRRGARPDRPEEADAAAAGGPGSGLIITP